MKHLSGQAASIECEAELTFQIIKLSSRHTRSLFLAVESFCILIALLNNNIKNRISSSFLRSLNIKLGEDENGFKICSNEEKTKKKSNFIFFLIWVLNFSGSEINPNTITDDIVRIAPSSSRLYS